MTIIEFYGKPGVGKSTVCDELEKKLSINYKVVNLQKFKSPQKFLKKLFFYFRVYSNYRIIILLSYLLKYSQMYTNSFNNIYWINRIMVLNFLIKQEVSKQNNEIILLDEGIIQFLTSLAHGIKISEKKIITKICNYFNDTYPKKTILIKCEIKLEDNILRLKKRNRINDRFIFSDINEMKKQLNIKENNLDFISSLFKCDKKVILNLEKDKNCEIIFDLIKGELEYSEI